MNKILFKILVLITMACVSLATFGTSWPGEFNVKIDPYVVGCENNTAPIFTQLLPIEPVLFNGEMKYFGAYFHDDENQEVIFNIHHNYLGVGEYYVVPSSIIDSENGHWLHSLLVIANGADSFAITTYTITDICGLSASKTITHHISP